MSAIPSAAAPQRAARLTADALRKIITPWLFVSPFVITFVLFTAFPLGFSIYLSFQEWNPVAGLDAMKFVGFDNYILAITDPWLWKSLYNTVWLAVVGGVPQHLIAVPTAYLLVASIRKARHFYTATLFVPYITSTVAAGLIFYAIFATRGGILNQALIALSEMPLIGLAFWWVPDVMPLAWTTSSALIKPMIALVVIWKYTGFNIVIYSAGFLTVPQDLYDAAHVDGCTGWQKFWHVALPMIRPFVFFGVTLTLIGQLQLFEEPFILTAGDSGGVGQAGLTTSYYFYLIGWEWLEMGSAAAVSWILVMIIALATAVHFAINGRKGLRSEEY